MGDWNPKGNDIFLKAVEFGDPAERARFVADQCVGDSALRNEVDALLGAHAQTEGILESSPTGLVFRSSAAIPSIETVGSVVGPYKLLSVIGEGGMGTVYRAEQTAPVRRFVAVKVIKAGMDTRKVINRFEAERQALALMDHPNIAKVLDAGSTPAGRPYFVMELVDGVPITDYCDKAKLTPSKRIDLFLPVCRAIQHAHQKGIIHRDIKPSNVLVGIYDGEPIPKVIDFGIAKATARRPTDETDMTAFGAVVGTLQYMSPEQAVTGEQDVDTRSDVYSLGVLLYELLTGSTPVTKDSLRDAAMAEALRVIREKDPPRPSTRLSETVTLASVAATRSTEPARLTGILRGELDWIVMKALEKDRARRYDSANNLAADLQRYQADEPVTAHPPSMGYRVAKTFRRHRAVVLTSAAMIALLIGGAGVSTWQAVRATAEKNQKEIARKEAVANLDRANAATAAEQKATAVALARLESLHRANNILGGIFQRLDPDSAEKGGTPIVTQIGQSLVAASDEFDADGIGDPFAVANLRMTIGRTLTAFGEGRRAIGPLEKAFKGFESIDGPNADSTLWCEQSLASAYQTSGDFDKSIATNLDLIARRSARFGPHDVAVIGTTDQLGIVYQAAGKNAEAIAAYEKAAKLSNEYLKLSDPEAIEAVGRLAQGYAAAGQPARAVPLLEEAVKRATTALGANSSATLRFRDDLGDAYKECGRLADALKTTQEVFDRERIAFGADDRKTTATENNLATILLEAGRPSDAVELLRDSVRRQQERDGQDNPSTLSAEGNLAMALLDDDKPDEAIPLIQKVARDTLARLGPDNAGTLEAFNNLAGAYQKIGHYAEAIELLKKPMARCRVVLGPDHPLTLNMQNGYAQALHHVGRDDEAIEISKTVLDRRTAVLGPEHPRTIDSLSNLAYLYSDSHHVIDAIPLYRQVLRLRTKTVGTNSLRPFDTQIDLADAEFQAGDTESAGKDVEEALTNYRRVLADRPLVLAGRMSEVAIALEAGHKYQRAAQVLGETVKIWKANDPGNWETFEAMSNQGDALAHLRQWDQAEPLLRTGYEGLRDRYATIPNSRKGFMPRSADRLAAVDRAMGRDDDAATVTAEQKQIAQGVPATQPVTP